MPHSNGDPEDLIGALLGQKTGEADAPPGTPSLEERVARLEARLRREVDPSIALERDLIDLGQVPSCGIHKTGNQTINNITDTEISFGTVTWDTDQMADIANNGITIRRAGIYLVTCSIQWTIEGTNLRTMRISVNDTISFTGQSINSHGTVAPRLSCAAPRYFDVGDTITVLVFHNKGANDQDILGSTATIYGPQLTATLIADTGDIRTEMA